jgi:hypothetical protein
MAARKNEIAYRRDAARAFLAGNEQEALHLHNEWMASRRVRPYTISGIRLLYGTFARFWAEEEVTHGS